jgi:PhnB protein
MVDKVKPVPDGFHTVTPHLTVRDGSRAIEFYKQAFGAEVRGVSYTPDGRVMHATLKIGDCLLMLNDEFPEWGGTLSPLSSGGSGVTLHIYVDNVDPVFERAVAAGAKVKMPLMDAFWGDRYGQVIDPFGHRWSLATHVRDLSPEQMEAEAKAAMAAMPKSA